LGGVFERFPDLKLAFVETEAWWIAPVMAVLDMRASIGDEWTEFAPAFAGSKPYTRLPSEDRGTKCYAGSSPFLPTQIALDRLGSAQDQPVEGFAIRSSNAMFGVDYPHPESIFPLAIDQARALAANPHVTEDDTRKVLFENAAGVYHFDLAALQPHIERVGFDLAA